MGEQIVYLFYATPIQMKSHSSLTIVTQTCRSKLLLLVLICAPQFFGFGQTLEYDVFVNGRPSGKATVTKTSISDQEVKIELKSSLKVQLLVSIHIEFEGYAICKDRVLQKSEVTVRNNGHLHSKTTTLLENDVYRIIRNKKTKPFTQGNINFTGYDLYYTVPIGKSSVYSLSNGTMDSIEKTDLTSFELIDAKNRKSLYRYNDKGIAEYIKIPQKPYDIEFKLNNN